LPNRLDFHVGDYAFDPKDRNLPPLVLGQKWAQAEEFNRVTLHQYKPETPPDLLAETELTGVIFKFSIHSADSRTPP
jgi:hypothetical protein